MHALDGGVVKNTASDYGLSQNKDKQKQKPRHCTAAERFKNKIYKSKRERKSSQVMFLAGKIPSDCSLMKKNKKKGVGLAQK